MTEEKNNTEKLGNNIEMDAAAKADKAKILKEQHINARFGSVAETFQFMAAALLPVGLATVIATAKGASVTAAASAGTAAEAITLGSIATAFAAPTAVVILGTAVLFTAIAIGSRYMASRHYHNAILNSSEMNAQHVAKYVAKELKAETNIAKTETNIAKSEHLENKRSDGKQWTQVIQESNKNLSLVRH